MPSIVRLSVRDQRVENQNCAATARWCASGADSHREYSVRSQRNQSEGLAFPFFQGGTMHVELTPLDKAVRRVERIYDLMESPVTFEQALPVLEDFLEEEVSRGETDEKTLAVHALTFLKTASFSS